MRTFNILIQGVPTDNSQPQSVSTTAKRSCVGGLPQTPHSLQSSLGLRAGDVVPRY